MMQSEERDTSPEAAVMLLADAVNATADPSVPGNVFSRQMR